MTTPIYFTNVNAVMVDIVCCINHIHFIYPLFADFLKAF